MEANRSKAVLLTAVAPLAWGTTYLTSENLLPPERPLLSAAVRALPAGLVIVLARRRLPEGAWWWRVPLLGICNIGLFFPLLFLGATHLPGGLASTLQASSPLVMMAFAYALLHERAGAARVAAALTGLSGVLLLLAVSADHVDAIGLAAATGSVISSSLGFVLTKKWDPPMDMLTLVGWQLTTGGLLLAPLALLIEGTPPALGVPELAGFAWMSIPGTVIAYTCWFHGLRRLPAGVVSLVGLLNPAVATLLGVVVANERFSTVQAVGLALVLGSVCAGPLSGDRQLPSDTRRRRQAAEGRALTSSTQHRGGTMHRSVRATEDLGDVENARDALPAWGYDDALERRVTIVPAPVLDRTAERPERVVTAIADLRTPDLLPVDPVTPVQDVPRVAS